jgi:hypothetical protein
MQNLFSTLDLVTDAPLVTDSDSILGYTRAEAQKRARSEKRVPICHLSLEGEAVILRANLERRGVSLRAEGQAIKCKGNADIIDRFAGEIARLKPQLLTLLLELNTKGVPPIPAGLLACDIEAARIRVTRAGLLAGLSEDERLQLVVCTACHWHGVEIPKAWLDWRPEANRNVTQ